MEPPGEERRADEADQGAPPEFDALTPPGEVVRGDRTRDDFFDAVLALDAPATAREVADIAGHGTDAAREYLSWFERMGIVTRVTETPATWERNHEYLQWRRVQRLTRAYTPEELLTLLDAAMSRADAYAAAFDADTPQEVSITDAATDQERSLEELWEAMSMWKTTRQQIALLERALQSAGDDATGDLAPV